MRSTSARSCSSKRSTGSAARAQHRVAELAHEPQRRVAPRARLRIELLDGGAILGPLDVDRLPGGGVAGARGRRVLGGLAPSRPGPVAPIASSVRVSSAGCASSSGRDAVVCVVWSLSPISV